MSKKFYWINFFLILILIFLWMKNYEEWINPKPKEKGGAPLRQKAPVPSIPAAVARKVEILSPGSFKMISEKNLFSPDRKEFPVPLAPDAKEVRKTAARPNVTLYGVAIGKEFGSAVVSNPSRRVEKGQRETMTVRVGDKVGEYGVAQILEDRITLELQEDSFDVLLYDPTRPKKRFVPVPAGKPAQPEPVGPSPSSLPPGISPTPTPTPTPPVPARELPGRSVRQRLEQRRLERQQREGVTPASPGRTKEEGDE